MKLTNLALTCATLAVAGMVAVCAADPASAAAPRGQRCTGLHTALENGRCVNTQFVNPDRVPDPCGGGACYRSGSQKHKKHKSTTSS
jgi:hypothetical protein